MRKRAIRIVVLVAVAATVASVGGVADGQGGSGPPEGAPELASPTGSGITLQWRTSEATARNGEAPVADPITACGSDEFTYLAELLEHDATQAEVPAHWGDATGAPKQVMVAGTVQSSSFGTGDLPFDHPFGSDFNMDVAVDPQYADFTQQAGQPSPLPMHVELEEGLFPHVPSAHGPATGEDWRDMSERARQNVQPGYLPVPGDRVIVMGRWILDCGHDNYFTELHPLSFMAWSHVEGDKTIVNFFFNPYRVMQLYNPDPSVAPRVNDPNRVNSFFTAHALNFLIGAVFRLQDQGPQPFCCDDHLDARVLLEAVRARPSPFWICPPEGTSGSRLALQYDIVARPGVRVRWVKSSNNGCARLDLRLGSSVTREPIQRTCVDPWTFLESAAGEEAGIGPIDIRDQLKENINPAFHDRVDIDPTQSCYDPLAGPSVQDDPLGKRVRTRNTWHPFYGRAEVYWAD